jgi:hypothetical protein
LAKCRMYLCLVRSAAGDTVVNGTHASSTRPTAPTVCHPSWFEIDGSYYPSRKDCLFKVGLITHRRLDDSSVLTARQPVCNPTGPGLLWLTELLSFQPSATSQVQNSPECTRKYCRSVLFCCIFPVILKFKVLVDSAKGRSDGGSRLESRARTA